MIVGSDGRRYTSPRHQWLAMTLKLLPSPLPDEHLVDYVRRVCGQMRLRYDVCRHHARLKVAGLHDVDSRTKTFS